MSMDRLDARSDAAVRRAVLGFFVLAIAACAPVQQGRLKGAFEGVPAFVARDGEANGWFETFDGAKLGLSVWRPEQAAVVSDSCAEAACGPAQDALAAPAPVIIAVHGMNDYAGAFKSAGTWWSAHGAIVYAYDQRGFGRSPRAGIWPEHELMRQDMRTAVAVARRMHPGSTIAVVGESMGASVAITAFASDTPPAADVLVLSGPGLYGWGALPILYSVSLWTSAHVRPSWIVTSPKGVRITPTDNIDKQIEMWKDPNVLKTTRIDSVYGVVSIMQEADSMIAKLTPKVPALLLYGARDEVIPELGVRKATSRLPEHVKTAYYARGYHMLMNDKQAKTVWSDVLAFVEDPQAPVASGAPPLPWRSSGAGQP
jgi:acylglycerol lipase